MKYVNKRTKIVIICPVHGEFLQTPDNHLAGKYGCTKCGNEKDRSTREEFIQTALNVHNNIYDYSKVIYVNSRTPITIICRKHGDFNQCPSKHLQGSGCSKCNMNHSKSAIKWLEYIAKQQNIKIQHAGNDGEFNIPCSFYKADGYCEQTKTIYEFNGCLYHGCPICYDENDTNPVSKKPYKELYQKTMKKEEFIKSQGYQLITIWEHEWRVIENEAIKFLNRPKIKIKLKNLNI